MPPRRAPLQQRAEQPTNKDTEIAIHPNIVYLRRQWKWAVVSQFLNMFHPVVADERYSVQAVEDDLAENTTLILPKIMHRLLYTTTLDRRINADTWQMYLRKQFIRRDPDNCPLGSEEEPIEWSSLSIEAKLDAFYVICEWPFANPTRVRTMMGDEDHYANWRIEPLGWDSKRNSYWYIAGERLWIQRSRALPPRPKKAAKSKAPAKPKPKQPVKPLPKKSIPTSIPPEEKSKRRGRPPRPQPEPVKTEVDASRNSTGRQTRARNKRNAPSDPLSDSRKRLRTAGTRMSSRLRGAADEDLDGWQEVPQEWLQADESGDEDSQVASSSRNSKRRRSATTDNDDDELSSVKSEKMHSADDAESDLTELSSSSEAEDNDEPEGAVDGVEEQVAAEEEKDTALEEKPADWDMMALRPLPPDPSDFVEWETICVSTHDWETVAEQFSKSTNSQERSLHRKLKKHIVPAVLALFADREREREERERALRQVDVFTGRKRSSRLAVIESQRERIRREQQERFDEDNKMDRSRRMEAREKNQVDEREKREERRRERELKAEAERETEERASRRQSEASMSEGADDAYVPGSSRPPAVSSRSRRTSKKTPEEEWELDCEVCQMKGWNQDDGKKITCCEHCGKWQHTQCHDAVDDHAQRPRRDWNKVDFVCQSCQVKNRARQANGTFTKVDPAPALNGTMKAKAPTARVSRQPSHNSQPPSRTSSHSTVPQLTQRQPPQGHPQHLYSMPPTNGVTSYPPKTMAAGSPYAVYPGVASNPNTPHLQYPPYYPSAMHLPQQNHPYYPASASYSNANANGLPSTSHPTSGSIPSPYPATTNGGKNGNGVPPTQGSYLNATPAQSSQVAGYSQSQFTPALQHAYYGYPYGSPAYHPPAQGQAPLASTSSGSVPNVNGGLPPAPYSVPTSHPLPATSGSAPQVQYNGHRGSAYQYASGASAPLPPLMNGSQYLGSQPLVKQAPAHITMPNGTHLPPILPSVATAAGGSYHPPPQ